MTAERVAEPRESVPAAVSVLTREQIERLPAENLAQLLRYLPGFYLHFGAGIGGVPMVSSRGFFGGARRRPRERPANRGLPQADVDAGARRRRVARVRVHDQATVGDTAECSNSDALVSLSSSRGPGSPCRGSASRRARAGTRSATTSEIPAEPGSPAAAGAQRAARGGEPRPAAEEHPGAPGPAGSFGIAPPRPACRSARHDSGRPLSRRRKPDPPRRRRGSRPPARKGIRPLEGAPRPPERDQPELGGGRPRAPRRPG